MDKDKRLYRKLKRDLKQAGNRKRRRDLQREMREGPADAAPTDAGYDFGRASSAGLNGNDRDATRRRDEDESA